MRFKAMFVSFKNDFQCFPFQKHFLKVSLFVTFVFVKFINCGSNPAAVSCSYVSCRSGGIDPCLNALHASLCIFELQAVRLARHENALIDPTIPVGHRTT